MSSQHASRHLSSEALQQAAREEARRFEEMCHWLESHMPPALFEEIEEADLLLIAHSLMGFEIQQCLSHLQLKARAITLCLDHPDADLRILKHYRMHGIKSYRSFTSNAPPPVPGVRNALRIATLTFMEYHEPPGPPIEDQKEIFALLKARNPAVEEDTFAQCLRQLSPRFLRSLGKERLLIALDMFFRAKTREQCQYEVRPTSSLLQIVLAWRNVPKHNFLYRLASCVHRHQFVLKRVHATYLDPYSRENILLMSLAVECQESDTSDFLRELVNLKYSEGMEMIEVALVDSGLITGNMGNLLKAICHFVHQVLVLADPNMYALSQVEEDLVRHPELVVKLCHAFEAKCHPSKQDLEQFSALRAEFLSHVEHLDTGHEMTDTRRKNVLKQAMYFVDHLLKTNFYRHNKTGFCFRLDPAYLELVPYERKDRFPELPFAVFFMKGMHSLGFHIRFKDLSRGGLRTVIPDRYEQMLVERANIFSECYHLAYTQQKKNKDIPEGGAKGIILIEPYERLKAEEAIYQKSLEAEGVAPDAIQQKVTTFHAEQKLEFLYHAQRAYIEGLLTLVNCHEDGTLKAKDIVDFYRKPEYLYLGPDENMHNEMIVWISNYSKSQQYKPMGAFISSRPGVGINHKEYGVTSLGVNVYMEQALKFLGIDPTKQSFTVKMSGGPDGDVAGNQILNLQRFFPGRAKLLALIDISGTLYDPQGLDLDEMARLFREAKPIRFYPHEMLHEGGYLLDLRTKREQTAYAQQTLCWRKKGSQLVQEWLSGNDTHSLLRHGMHATRADIFIPGGGRPKTLNETNWRDFLDETGKPTSHAIVEGANLYLTHWARRSLEKLGVLILKDSSANKGGVICSSLEVLCSLVLTEEEFLKEKERLVKEILAIIRSKALFEADLILHTHQESHAFLTDISEWISERINTFTYQILGALESKTLSNDPEDPFLRCLLAYCPPTLRTKYQDRVLHNVPDIHKKAIIACHVASRAVYTRGLSWSPSIVDALPLLVQDTSIVGS